MATDMSAEAVRPRRFRLHGLHETALIFLVLLGIEWIAPGPAFLARLSPHPFWIPVILVSVQYGRVSGLAAAALATALAGLAGWPAQTPQEDFYTYSLRIWREPALWIIGALLIGGLRSRQIRDRQALEAATQLAEAQRNALGAFCEALQAELGQFERAAATVPAGSAAAALEALHALRCGGASEAIDRLPAALAAWLGEARWSLHLTRDGSLNRVAATPLEGGCAVTGVLPLARLYDIARRTPRTLSVFEEHDAEILDGIGIFACAIRCRYRAGTLGLLVVEAVEPGRLSPALGLATSLLADTLGTVLDPALAPVAPLLEVPPVDGLPMEAPSLEREMMAFAAIDPARRSGRIPESAACAR